MDDSDFDHLPTIPHEQVAEVECCGCLIVRLREGAKPISFVTNAAT